LDDALPQGPGYPRLSPARPYGILASGVRHDESVTRAGSVRPIGQWEGAPIVAPIFDWTTEETWAYFRDRGFERAPAYSTLQISGDCLCGAYAREDEPKAVEVLVSRRSGSASRR
jgi:3'-phosphoadenosine 5'-phosphosulfate sulfotransferase (PAPS reductase)/FAD synthetase